MCDVLALDFRSHCTGLSACCCTYLHVLAVQRSEEGGVDVGELSYRPQQSWKHKIQTVQKPSNANTHIFFLEMSAFSLTKWTILCLYYCREMSFTSRLLCSLQLYSLTGLIQMFVLIKWKTERQANLQQTSKLFVPVTK